MEVNQEEIIQKIEKLDIKEGDTFVFYTSARSYQKLDQIISVVSPFFKKKGATCIILQSEDLLSRVRDTSLFARVSRAEKTLSKIRSLLVGTFFLDVKDKKHTVSWYTTFGKKISEMIENYYGTV
jgi:hypothetical protein